MVIVHTEVIIVVRDHHKLDDYPDLKLLIDVVFYWLQLWTFYFHYYYVEKVISEENRELKLVKETETCNGDHLLFSIKRGVLSFRVDNHF